jgi:hypothetical protein
VQSFKDYLWRIFGVVSKVQGSGLAGGSELGVTMSMVFSITLPVTFTPVLTTAPVTEIAAPATAPTTVITPQPDNALTSAATVKPVVDKRESVDMLDIS